MKRYFSSPGNDYVFNATYSNGFIYISGTTEQSIVGTSHPELSVFRPFVFMLDPNNGNILWSVYTGASGGTGYGDTKQLVATNDSIYQIFDSRQSYGTPTEPIQGSDDKNHIFTKLDLNGGLQWLSFLGVTGEDINSLNETAFLVLGNGSLLHRSIVSTVNPRYTSNIDSIQGEGTNVNQIADLIVNSITGNFESIKYSTNLSLPQIQKTEIVREVCLGKVVYGHYLKLSSAASPTQFAIETANVN